jgi:hypothetical protein
MTWFPTLRGAGSGRKGLCVSSAKNVAVGLMLEIAVVAKAVLGLITSGRFGGRALSAKQA